MGEASLSPILGPAHMVLYSPVNIKTNRTKDKKGPNSPQDESAVGGSGSKAKAYLEGLSTDENKESPRSP